MKYDGIKYEVIPASQWTKEYPLSTEPPQHFSKVKKD